jgi:hypothetical protein
MALLARCSRHPRTAPGPGVDERLQLAAARLILRLAVDPAGTGMGADAEQAHSGGDELADHEIQRVIDAARSQRHAARDNEARFAVWAAFADTDEKGRG